ncbi:hypothetical protein EJB05_54106, partial [Eragrostis curvula]
MSGDTSFFFCFFLSSSIFLRDVLDDAGVGGHASRSLRLKRPSGRPQGKLNVCVAVEEAQALLRPQPLPGVGVRLLRARPLRPRRRPYTAVPPAGYPAAAPLRPRPSASGYPAASPYASVPPQPAYRAAAATPPVVVAAVPLRRTPWTHRLGGAPPPPPPPLKSPSNN